MNNIDQLKQGTVYSSAEIAEIIAEIKENYSNTPIKRVCAYGREYKWQDSGGFNKLFEVIKVYEDHVDIVFKAFKNKDSKHRLNRFAGTPIDIESVILEEHRGL